MATKKTKKCKRCNGTGGYESHVDMGRCWECNAFGGFAWVSVEDAVAEYDARSNEVLAYYVEEGRRLAGRMDRRRQRLERQGKAVADSAEDVSELARLRSLWLDRANRSDLPSQGRWKPAKLG